MIFNVDRRKLLRPSRPVIIAIMIKQWVYLNHDSKADNELTFRDIEKPKLLSPNDVLVRIRAVSLNYRDVFAQWKRLT